MPRDEVVAYLERYAAGSRRPCARASRSPRCDRAGRRLPRSRRRTASSPPAPWCSPPARTSGRTGPPCAATLPADLPQLGRRRLPQPGGSAAGPGAGGRQRPVRLPDRRGAARGGPRGLPRVRARAVVPPPHRGPRPRLVGARDGLPDRPRRRAAEPRGAAGGQRRRDRARRRPRPPPADAAAHGVTLLGHLVGAEGRVPASLPTSSTASRGATSATPSSWGSCAGSSPSAGCPSRRSPTPEPFHAEPPERLDLTGFGAVVFAAGFRPDYASWVRLPGRVRRARLPDPRRGREHRRPWAVLRRASTSCASASRRCSSGWARTRRSSPPDRRAPPSSRPRSPRRISRTRQTRRRSSSTSTQTPAERGRRRGGRA